MASSQFLGRVVGGAIELEAPATALEGLRVRVTVEVVDPDEHPVHQALRETPADDRPKSTEEQASIDAARGDGRFITTDELRARRAARDQPG